MLTVGKQPRRWPEWGDIGVYEAVQDDARAAWAALNTPWQRLRRLAKRAWRRIGNGGND